MEVKLWHVGAGVASLLLLVGVVHAVGAPDEEEKKPKQKKSNDKPVAGSGSVASVTPAKPAAQATLPVGIAVGDRVEAQYRDGQWYGATVNKSNLSDPDAVRWDAGTPPAAANPKTGTSPAQAVRKPAAAPGTKPTAAQSDAAPTKKHAGSSKHAKQKPAADASSATPPDDPDSAPTDDKTSAPEAIQDPSVPTAPADDEHETDTTTQTTTTETPGILDKLRGLVAGASNTEDKPTGED